MLLQTDSLAKLNAWLTTWMLHVSCAFCLQTEKTSMDMDNSNDKVFRNTDTHSTVSITNISDSILMLFFSVVANWLDLGEKHSIQQVKSKIN